MAIEEEYTTQITRANPTCIVFLIDQSLSMSDPSANDQKRSKAQVLADALNRLLAQIVLKCNREDGVRPYIYLSVVGYGDTVGPAFSGALSKRDLIPIGEISDEPIEVITRERDDGTGNLVKVKLPVWVNPVARGNTPMCQALKYTKDLLTNKWLIEHPNCFPPIVINISDGEANDGDPRNIAEEIRNLRTSNGNVLMFNIHLSSTSASPILYPDNDKGLPDTYSNVLYQMSSVLPNRFRESANERFKEIPISENSRGFVYNSDSTSLIVALNVGTYVEYEK